MQNIGFAYAIGAAVTWGVVYTIDQKILASSSPLTYLFINSLLSAVILLPFLFFDHGSVKAALSDKKEFWLILISVIMAALANFLIFTGIKLINAEEASIIEIAYPFFVALFSYFVFSETPNAYFFLGGALIFIGSVVIIKFG